MEDLKIVNADNLLYTSLDETEFIIEDILPIGLHIFCGAPKVGKSWLMLDICIKVSKGEEIWNLKTNKCDVLYLALEDTYQRLQKRLFKLTNEIDSNFHISIESNKIANGLTSQLEQTLKKYPDIKLIVIDTLQKVRKQNNDINYSNDYTDISLLKQFADKNKIAVAGDSAGGNYTAAVSLKARDEEIPMIALQVLIYPAVAIGDASASEYSWSEDMIKIAPELEEKVRPLIGLGRPSKDFTDPILSSYLSSFDLVNDPYVSPMVAKSHSNLPKAILVGAEFDGLRIQTEFYAKQLQDAGVNVTCYRYKGMTHAFIDKLGFVPQAEDLASIIADSIIKL